MRATSCVSLSVAFVLATASLGAAHDQKPPDDPSKAVAWWIEVLKHGEFAERLNDPNVNPPSSAEAREVLGPDGPYAKTAIPFLIDALGEETVYDGEPV